VELVATEEDGGTIDSAYRIKCRPYAAPIIAPRAGAATLNLVPRATPPGA
jgi:hypothetical protein